MRNCCFEARLMALCPLFKRVEPTCKFVTSFLIPAHLYNFLHLHRRFIFWLLALLFSSVFSLMITPLHKFSVEKGFGNLHKYFKLFKKSQNKMYIFRMLEKPMNQRLIPYFRKLEELRHSTSEGSYLREEIACSV